MFTHSTTVDLQIESIARQWAFRVHIQSFERNFEPRVFKQGKSCL